MIERSQLPLKRLLTIWWALMWRGLVFGLGGGFVLGFVIGVVFALLGLSAYTRVVSGVAGLVLGFPLGLWVLLIVLTKRYRGFELSLTEITEPA